jgi:uncharacterized metal-binding protein
VIVTVFFGAASLGQTVFTMGVALKRAGKAYLSRMAARHQPDCSVVKTMKEQTAAEAGRGLDDEGSGY